MSNVPSCLSKIRLSQSYDETFQNTVLHAYSLPRGMSDPPPRKRVSQACRPCGVKKIKVRGHAVLQLRSKLTSCCSAMEHTLRVVLAKAKASSVPMGHQSAGKRVPSSIVCLRQYDGQNAATRLRTACF